MAFPAADVLLIVDNSTGHSCYPPGSLIAEHMNVNEGGARAAKQAKTVKGAPPAPPAPRVTTTFRDGWWEGQVFP